MSKVRYAATLSTGERLTRSSARSYRAAWAVMRDGKVLESGFAADAKLAESAARQARNILTGRRTFNEATSSRAKPIGALRYLREIEQKNGGRAAWAAAIAAKEAEHLIEVVPAKIVPEGF